MANYVVSKHSDEDKIEMIEGVKRKTLVYGDETLLCKFFLKKDKALPLHSHPYEQTGYLVSGELVFSIDGTRYSLNAGDSWCIKKNIEHGAMVIEDSVLIEVFSPAREDYIDKS